MNYQRKRLFEEIDLCVASYAKNNNEGKFHSNIYLDARIEGLCNAGYICDVMTMDEWEFVSNAILAINSTH